MEEDGGNLLAEAPGAALSSYPFLYAVAADLRVEDVEALLLKYKETLLRYESLARGYSTWRRAQVRAPGGGAALPGAREGEQAAGAAEASPSLI